MITLHAFGPAFGLPDASPFAIKTLVHLKMSGQPYRITARGLFKAPKGKIPYIEDEGQVVADSTFIRWHLEEKYKLDFDQGLTGEQRAMGWAIEKLLEDNCYWVGLYWRWMDEASYRKASAVLFARLPAPMRGPLGMLLRRRMRGYLHAQGMGRHSEAEMMRIARQGVDTVATLLGDKPFVMGERPTGTDAIVYAMTATLLCPYFDSPLRRAAEGHPNLAAYGERMRARFFAEEQAGASQQSLFPPPQQRRGSDRAAA